MGGPNMWEATAGEPPDALDVRLIVEAADEQDDRLCRDGLDRLEVARGADQERARSDDVVGA